MVGASRWLSILTTHAGNDAVMPCCGLVGDTFIPAVDELVRVDVNVIQQKSPPFGSCCFGVGGSDHIDSDSPLSCCAIDYIIAIAWIAPRCNEAWC